MTAANFSVPDPLRHYRVDVPKSKRVLPIEVCEANAVESSP